jgi:hypothetical protein
MITTVLLFLLLLPCRLTILAQMLCLQLCFRTKISLVLVQFLVISLFSDLLCVGLLCKDGIILARQ